MADLRRGVRAGLLAFAACLVLSVAAPAWADPAPDPAAPVRATAARLAGDAQRTRLILDITGTIQPRAFPLADPDRLVVELPQIAFDLPGGTGRTGRGLVSAFRYGLIAPGKSRLVVDLSGPAVVDKMFVLDPVEDQPARLVIDLVSAPRQTFLTAVELGRAPAVTGSLPALLPDAGPPAAGQGLAGLPVVVIDPGHGGIDAGASAPSGEQEKAITFAFARELADKLVATGRYKAVLTRTDDSFVSLADRVAVARRSGAALFISVHADTLPDPFGVRGATVYTLSDKASDAAAARYAEEENRADAISGVDLGAERGDVADILVDLTMRETKVFSAAFAKVLVDDFASAATLNKHPRRSAGFWVLKAPDVPSVLLELGYLSSPQDLALLTSEPWRDRATDAVRLAVDGFFAMHAAAARPAAPVAN